MTWTSGLTRRCCGCPPPWSPSTSWWPPPPTWTSGGSWTWDSSDPPHAPAGSCPPGAGTSAKNICKHSKNICQDGSGVPAVPGPLEGVLLPREPGALPAHRGPAQRDRRQHPDRGHQHQHSEVRQYRATQHPASKNYLDYLFQCTATIDNRLSINSNVVCSVV